MTHGNTTVSILDQRSAPPRPRRLPDFALETVVVNLERGVYHGLNPTAGRMLEALDRACDVRGTPRRPRAELGQPHEVVETDLAVVLLRISSSAG